MRYNRIRLGGDETATECIKSARWYWIQLGYSCQSRGMQKQGHCSVVQVLCELPLTQCHMISCGCENVPSYINSATLTPSLWKTVTVGKTFLPALSEFYANAHLETPEHSSSSSRIEQPTCRKDAFHIGLRCSGTGQVINKPCKSWRTSGMPVFEGINTESDPS